jgi:predicted dehydrogenase
MSEPVTVGLIGCGWIAGLAHVPTLQRSDSANVIAIAEPDAERRASTASRIPGVRLFDDGRELLAESDSQAVLIALPTALAPAMAEAAFRAGRHVYIEKPGAPSATEWRSVVDAWSESGCIGMVGYNFRRNPIFRDAVARIRAGAVGRVLSVQSRFTWAADKVEGWRASTGRGGGALLDLASHHVDLLCQLLDVPATEVQCTTHAYRAEQDVAELVLGFGETSAQIFVSSAAGANQNGFVVVGSEGTLHVNLLDALPRPILRRPGRLERVRRALIALDGLHPVRLLRSPGREPSFAVSLNVFVDSIVKHVQSTPTPRDALDVLAILDAAAESARRDGARISLPTAASA